MSDSNKKRSGSFKKFFPNLFFRSKDKSKETSLKVASNSAKSNQYHDPRTVMRSDKQETSDNEIIYENLKPNRYDDSESQSIDIISSNHSSSSTLVSDSVKNRSQDSDVTSDKLTHYAARPQVPPKPQGEMNSPIQSSRKDTTQYPDVYYHSLEKMMDKITPLDDYEMYRASQVKAHPASVGAEIKRVSTKFLISPKKEAEVRTIQPTRARSLSFDHEKNRTEPQIGNENANKTTVKKSYNYSAPTSPIPTNHKVPHMPKTVSPYELVRKNMIEAEEKRNSLSRTSLRNRLTLSRQEFGQPSLTSTLKKENSKLDDEKTRKKVEAFYWQKLKEMKAKEDEYYLGQSLNSSVQNPMRQFNSSTCKPLTVEPRCCSLPRGRDLQTVINQPMYYSPFVRGAPERRTDTYLKSRTQCTDPEIIYRHPEKLSMAQPVQATTPIFQRGSLTRENITTSQPKRVSFEDNCSKTESDFKSGQKIVNFNYTTFNQNNAYSANAKNSEVWKGPPRPPVRTTSVGVKNLKLMNCRKIINLAGRSHYVYSESESGSEAGEIQRILLNRGKLFSCFYIISGLYRLVFNQYGGYCIVY